MTYLEKEISIRDAFDTVQYRFILIPKMGKVILKAHHCLGDGMAISSFLLHLSGEETTRAIPAFKPEISWS